MPYYDVSPVSLAFLHLLCVPAFILLLPSLIWLFTTGFFLSASLPSLLDDHSRVRLQALEGEQSSDYINANYVDVSTQTSQHHQRKGHCASPREDGGDAGAAVPGGPRGPGCPYCRPIISAHINTPRAFIFQLKVGRSLSWMDICIGMTSWSWMHKNRVKKIRFLKCKYLSILRSTKLNKSELSDFFLPQIFYISSL